jgi:hypothetical protein
MRFDTLAATAESAVGPEDVQILETNPEFPEEVDNPNPQNDRLVENYRGFDIYETATAQYYTIPEVIVNGEVEVAEDYTEYLIENVKGYIDESLE